MTNDEIHAARVQLLKTKEGGPKHRFTLEEKIQLLDPTSPIEVTKTRLVAFQRLFAPRLSGGIITKCNSGPRAWTALRGLISLTHIVRHLSAAAIPTRAPQWIGARSFDSSSFLCIDLDATRESEQSLAGKPDLVGQTVQVQCRPRLPKSKTAKPSLLERQHYLEELLRMAGVNPRNRGEVLVQRTPSGGLHYYLFFNGEYGIDQYRWLLEMLGLQHTPGQFEFFPSTNHALRLPFGHIPGRPDRPKAWIDFIDRYLARRVRRHGLETLYDNIEMNLGRRIPILPSQNKPSKICTGRRTTESLRISSSKRDLEQGQGHAVEPSPISMESVHDFEKLVSTGIQQVGTRNQVLNHLAAHLIWFKNCSAEDASTFLVEWAMDRRHRSTDIARDLGRGTTAVPRQIRNMCRWYENRKRGRKTTQMPDVINAGFALSELHLIHASIAQLPNDERREQAEFLLHFLRFARQHGQRSTDGKAWEAAPAIRQVVRRWPGCHHMNYRHRIEIALNSGMLELIREKQQSANGTGRARTYRLNIVPDSLGSEAIEYSHALEMLSGASAVNAGWNKPENPTPSEPLNNLREHDGTQDPIKREDTSPAQPSDSPTLHPPCSDSGVGTGAYQRNQEPDAATGVLGQDFGAFRPHDQSRRPFLARGGPKHKRRRRQRLVHVQEEYG